MKRCGHCREILALDAFARDMTKRDGLRSSCRGCMAAIKRERRTMQGDHVRAVERAAYRRNAPARRASSLKHYYSHREQVLARAREWKRVNVKHVLAYSRRYYWEHRASILHARRRDVARYREAKTLWRSKHREHERAQGRALRMRRIDHYRARRRRWYALHPAQEKAAAHRRRARVLSAEGSHTARDLVDLYEGQGGLCAYCRQALPERWHVDHRIPICRGGSNWPSNLALSCATCNLRKWSLTDTEFLARYPSLAAGQIPQLLEGTHEA